MTHRLIPAALAAFALALPAAAQDGAAGGPSLIGQLLFFIPLILIFYFLLIRPQQQQRKRHQEMVAAIKRGDTVITSGGLIAKVIKVADDELTVELAEGVRSRLMRQMVADVRAKGEPVAAND
ncbi:MAG: preprotein translocase subunit YajC [Alphaproteobacteria bacterium]|jgi:preprotein translocase subunit YajC|nr:preprotein translocase subunit YajC [Alphaproteobacteria bacterium]